MVKSVKGYTKYNYTKMLQQYNWTTSLQAVDGNPRVGDFERMIIIFVYNKKYFC